MVTTGEQEESSSSSVFDAYLSEEGADKTVREKYKNMNSKKTILIAEDDFLNRELLAALLSDHYDTIEAENGLEALDILRQHKDAISLVLLDLNMPVMDGYGFLEEVKKDEELSLVPVIVTTQEGSKGVEVDALKRGATDFVPKPYNREVLIHRVASIINLRENAAFVNQIKEDRLTGLLNKDYFCMMAEELIAANPDIEYSILCTDIENFKLYNDVFGFEAGNDLLRELARLMREEVGRFGLCGRMNADRFVCIIERARERAWRDRNVERITREGGLLKNSILRWGIYEIEERDLPVDKMCDRAQLAVDSIKDKYNKYYQVYDESLREKILRDKMITDSMQHALSDGEFMVYLQPKYNLRDNLMCGGEALVRWNSPIFGMLSPGIFIPLFEKNGFIFELDCFVWETACRVLKKWRDEGRNLVPISVNVSRTDLFKSNLVDTLVGLVDKYEIDPSLLHLEITESAYSDNPRQIISTVEILHSKGFIIEMDDFGSGYSSLNMLGSMKVDILKLDRGFIVNETAKHPSQSILSDVIVMAHKLHLEVVAEGIETVEQINRLKAENCDIAQGFLMAKPMPIEEFEALVERNGAEPEADHHITSANAIKRGLLIADIDRDYVASVESTFKNTFKVFTAYDTEGTMKVIETAAEQEFEMISVIILSHFLPDNGASRILDEIRQNPKLWNIPVLLLIEGSCDAPRLPEMDKVNDFLCRLHPMFDLQKKIDHLIDINEYQRELCNIRDEAYRDFLTGLLNRRGLDEATSSITPNEMPIALCMFDIDNMKEINDTKGHDCGDRSLMKFADVLRRKSSDDDILVRYGGDEFIAILKRITNPNDAKLKCEAVIREFREDLAEEGIEASCSGGIAICENRVNSCELVFEQADKALYDAKSKNKNNVQIWGGYNEVDLEKYYHDIFSNDEDSESSNA